MDLRGGKKIVYSELSNIALKTQQQLDQLKQQVRRDRDAAEDEERADPTWTSFPSPEELRKRRSIASRRNRQRNERHERIRHFLQNYDGDYDVERIRRQYLQRHSPKTRETFRPLRPRRRFRRRVSPRRRRRIRTPAQVCRLVRNRRTVYRLVRLPSTPVPVTRITRRLPPIRSSMGLLFSLLGGRLGRGGSSKAAKRAAEVEKARRRVQEILEKQQELARIRQRLDRAYVPAEGDERRDELQRYRELMEMQREHLRIREWLDQVFGNPTAGDVYETPPGDRGVDNHLNLHRLDDEVLDRPAHFGIDTCGCYE